MTIYQYRESLDRAIIDILYLEKNMSFDTFDRHIDTLLKQNIVEKKKIKNRVFYNLTQECRNTRDNGHDINL